MKKCACRGSFLERFIQPSILLLLNEAPMHGFSILKRLYKSDVMDYSGIDPTGLYRTLKKMEEAGLLASRVEAENGIQAKRVYEITEEGRICLVFWRSTLLDYRDRIERLAMAIPETIDDELFKDD